MYVRLGRRMEQRRNIRGQPTGMTKWLTYCCRLRLRHKEGNRALHVASFCGHMEVAVTLLRTRTETNAQNKAGGALHIAASRGHVEVVRRLLRDGVTAQNKEGDTALHIATSMGFNLVVPSFLVVRVDVKVWNKSRKMVLLEATVAGHVNMIKILLQNWGSISANGGPYGNVLQAAAYGGNEVVWKCLASR